MTRADDGFFRGSELPRLLFLVGLLVVGVAVVFRLLATQAERDARPKPRTVANDPLPPADDVVELRGMIDRARLTPRENPGYLMLLERVRSTEPAELARRARRDVLFSQLINNPARYRGIPIRIQGTLKRVMEQTGTGSKLFPTGRVYEGYAYTPDSQNHPWMLVFENPPPSLPIGDDLNTYFVFDGYFLKLNGYHAGDDNDGAIPLDVPTRFAPLLIGRLVSIDPEATPAPATTAPTIPWWAPIAALLVLYAIVRWAMMMRRLNRATATPRRYFTAVNDEIDTERLSDWLNSVSDSRLVNEVDEDS